LLWWAGLRSGVSTHLAVDAAVTVFVLVAGCNAFNLLDNMDGVAASTATATAAGLLFLGAIAKQPSTVVVAAALCGASLGFLRYNLVEARLFLGNGGALFMGFLLAGLALELRPPGGPLRLLVPVCVMAVPALDTGMVLISRLAFKQRPFQGGLDHVSHRLVTLGQPARRAAVMHGVAAVAGAAGGGLSIELARAEPAAIVLTAFTVAAIALLHVKVYEDSAAGEGRLVPMPEEVIAQNKDGRDAQNDRRRVDSWPR
jgi:UDP-GlcNAc:undecaprenyl-phosphate GlcNAc-1-phosphate transferase